MVKSSARLLRQMAQRGWTMAQIEEARASDPGFPAVNLETDGPARRYIHPATGRSLVIDDLSGDVIHVGGGGVVY